MVPRGPAPPLPSTCALASGRSFDWDKLGAQCQFDVIMMDPPWQLATAAPTRGVALGYRQACTSPPSRAHGSSRC